MKRPRAGAAESERSPVVIVGAGMVGLTLAIDLVRQEVPVVLLEKNYGPAEGSRSICQAKRSLEIWDRLGVGEAIRDRGCTWKIGRIFHRDRELFNFDMLPERGHKMPAFVNLQQPILEQLLRDRFRRIGGEIRSGHELIGVQGQDDGVTAEVQGPAPYGRYAIQADWLISCEGVRSTVRRLLGVPFDGDIFEDKFLICDVKMKATFPAERWFWFEPPFHSGQTALLHKQADDVWRIDLQLGWDADQDAEKDPSRARARIAAMLGHDRFEFEWISVYVFQCRTLQSYVHKRVIFAGDSAHQVSPFGARGGNGGVQDVDNLGWKLARIIDGRCGAALLESYNAERVFAAKENILHSTRATDFMTPKSPASRLLRDQTLSLAADHLFARSLVNAGRLSTPAHLSSSPLNSPDDAQWMGARTQPGAPAVDAPIRRRGENGYLLDLLGGRFVVLAKSDRSLPKTLTLQREVIDVLQVGRDLDDSEQLVSERYDLQPDSFVLFRPDQHVAMRRRVFNEVQIGNAVARSLGQDEVLVS